MQPLQAFTFQQAHWLQTMPEMLRLSTLTQPGWCCLNHKEKHRNNVLVIHSLLFSWSLFRRKKASSQLDIFEPTEIKQLPLTSASHTSVHLISLCRSLLCGKGETKTEFSVFVAKRIYLSTLINFTRRKV